MKLHRKGLLAATGAAAAGLALTGGLIAASAASAATAGHRAMTAQGSAAVFNTLSSGHMDTTSYSGPATFTSPNGPVWAIDTLREHWVVTSCAASPTCTSSARPRSSASARGSLGFRTFKIHPKDVVCVCRQSQSVTPVHL